MEIAPAGSNARRAGEVRARRDQRIVRCGDGPAAGRLCARSAESNEEGGTSAQVVRNNARKARNSAYFVKPNKSVTRCVVRSVRVEFGHNAPGGTNYYVAATDSG